MLAERDAALAGVVFIAPECSAASRAPEMTFPQL